jgi:hypothetical protein
LVSNKRKDELTMSSTFFGALTQGAKFGGAKFLKDKQTFEQQNKGTLPLLVQQASSSSLCGRSASLSKSVPIPH